MVNSASLVSASTLCSPWIESQQALFWYLHEILHRYTILLIMFKHVHVVPKNVHLQYSKRRSIHYLTRMAVCQPTEKASQARVEPICSPGHRQFAVLHHCITVTRRPEFFICCTAYMYNSVLCSYVSCCMYITQCSNMHIETVL